MNSILFLDLEVNVSTKKVEEVGFIFGDKEYRGKSLDPLIEVAQQARYICGHNILDHDLHILKGYPSTDSILELLVIDTLYLSPLFRPNRIEHSLDKDYHLSTPWKNDPLADARLSKGLLVELWEKYDKLGVEKMRIYSSLLSQIVPFKAFFGLSTQIKLFDNKDQICQSIISIFGSSICIKSDFRSLLDASPVELAYVLALVASSKPAIITPSWLQFKFPKVHHVFDQLRAQNCGHPDCEYCQQKLEPIVNLQKFFGFPGFRRFEGDGEIPLQEQAVRSALNNESLLAIFPTGGGKSLTFQLPALIRGEAKGALTVIISPLVALMKDQVSVLNKRDIVNVVAINGLLDPLQRSEAISKVEDGTASLLYIAPESLRSNTILRLLTGRLIDRFVIDEAHCFSSWGQDFRVDYLYIAPFIRLLKERKGIEEEIPVSCFTATARIEVVQDIQDYFKKHLGLTLNLHQTLQRRTNLVYRAIETKEDTDKFDKLIHLLEEKEGAAIVYVSRVKKTEVIAEALKKNGINAEPYHGKMESKRKNRTQEVFSSGEIDVIVATSAFGMGVDKDNVGLVLHYEISNSLENYVQEAGRAGRDPSMQAKCVILFNENDLNKHFALLQGNKLNKKEISQIWRGIKWFKKHRISKSALEIAKAAGWDEEMRDLETRVKTAINALEHVGYIEREQNAPRIFATGLIPDNFEKAWNKVKQNAFRFTEKQKEYAQRILQFLYGKTETRVDYMSDILGISKWESATILNLFKEIGILSDNQDLTASIDISQSQNNSQNKFREASTLEKGLLSWLGEGGSGRIKKIDLREANDTMEEKGINSSISLIRNLMRYWEWKGYLKKERIKAGEWLFKLIFKKEIDEILKSVEERIEWSDRILNHLIKLAKDPKVKGEPKDKIIEFSVVAIKKELEFSDLLGRSSAVSLYQQNLLYLQNIEAIDLKDGMFIYYNRLTIKRTEIDNKKQYTKADYEDLARYYENKIEQVHIVGEYAQRLLTGYIEAITFTDDYFQMDYDEFLRKYFPKRRGKIRRPLTEKKFKEIFGNLDTEQKLPVKDSTHQQILVAAGPGSGKTRVLVHKMASLLLIEDIKPEQFLMLAFSRPAANEFRQRLKHLVPGLAQHVDIFTYHGFAFHLVGKKGDLQKSTNIINHASLAIRERNIPLEKVAAKSVVILDEFQDISQQEHDFLEALIHQAGEIRIVAAGDDDQSIYEFRGSSATYMRKLIEKENSQTYFLSRNYRSKRNIVDFANQFLRFLPVTHRIKAEQPLIAHQEDIGSIRLAKYTSGFILEPFVNAIIKRKPTGISSVLTSTNEEALQVATLLQQKGVPAILVSKQDGFSLRHLVEIQAFSSLILREAKKELGFITDEVWKEALEKIKLQFEQSKNLDLLIRIVEAFEKEFSRKYKGDWLEYISNLRIEDFYFPNQAKVFVSTMHKAKGKEFENVFLLLEGFDIGKDENKRVLYVAITRAKQNLEIHTNCPIFDTMEVEGLERLEAYGAKEQPGQIALTCGLKNVNLNFYKSNRIQTTLSKVLTGDSLRLMKDPYPCLQTRDSNPVAAFSKEFWKRIGSYRKKGYQIDSASIDNLVWWKAKDGEKQYLVALPKIIIRLKVKAL